MRKRIEPTLVEKAIQTVSGFERVYKLLHQQVILRRQSISTLENYIRRIAQIALMQGDCCPNIGKTHPKSGSTDGFNL